MVGDRPEGSMKGFAALLGPDPKGFVGPLAMRCGGALSSPNGLAGLREPAASTEHCTLCCAARSLWQACRQHSC